MLCQTELPNPPPEKKIQMFSCSPSRLRDFPAGRKNKGRIKENKASIEEYDNRLPVFFIYLHIFFDN